MPIEKRAYPRFRTQGIRADITLGKPSYYPHHLTGDVIDISFSGIKLLLDSPFPEIKHGKITIEIRLPESGIPLTIKGSIKYFASSSELGLYCGDDTPGETMDRLLFECVKAD